MPNYFIEPRKLTDSPFTKMKMEPKFVSVKDAPTNMGQGPIGTFKGGS